MNWIFATCADALNKKTTAILPDLTFVHYYAVTMAPTLPFRDINLHASSAHYAFSSPSSPTAPTLVVDRPTGDLRLNDDTLLGTKRVSSIAGILGIIKLKLGQYNNSRFFGYRLSDCADSRRQIYHSDNEGPAYGTAEGPYDLQSYRN